MRSEGEVGYFLGLRIEKLGDQKFTLTQAGLIHTVIKSTNMENSNTVSSPIQTIPLETGKDGDKFDEKLEYTIVVGMLIYLVQNSRPDISYAVH